MSKKALSWSTLFDQFHVGHYKRDFYLKKLVEQYQDSLKPKAVDETKSKPIISKSKKSKNTTKKTASKKIQETSVKTKSNAEQSKIAKKTTRKK